MFGATLDARLAFLAGAGRGSRMLRSSSLHPTRIMVQARRANSSGFPQWGYSSGAFTLVGACGHVAYDRGMACSFNRPIIVTDGWGGMGGNYGKSGKDIKGGFRPSPYGKEGKDGKDGKGVGKVSGKGFGKGLGKGVKGGDKAGSIRAVFATARKGGVLGSAEVPEGCAIYVNCLPPDTTDLDLYKLFSPFGAIAPSGIRAMMEDDGSCKGFGFVDFLDPTAADAAIVALNNLILPDGSSMNCSLKKPSLKGKGKGKDGSTGKATFEAE